MENWTLSWSKLTELNEETIEALPDELQGVYRLSREEGDKTIVFFVDGSDNLKKELLSHLSEESKSDCVRATVSSYNGKCYFRYSIITNPEVRSAAVKKMFRVYQPTCNTVEPEGRDDIEVNLN